MEVLGQDLAPRRPDAGKVLGLVRSDAPEGAKGKPCGESHISKAYTCSKKSGGLTPAQRQKLARVAAAGGLTITAALGLGLILRGRTKPLKKAPALPGRNLKALPQKSSALTEEDLVMLNGYIEGSSSLNRALRNGRYNDIDADDIRIIDNWVKKTPSQLGRYWRGIASENTANFFRNATPGEIYTDAGYGSFSRSLNVAKSFSEEHKRGKNDFAERVVLRTRGRLHPMPARAIDEWARGRGLIDGGSAEGEEEFIAPRNSQYRITRIRRGVTLNPGNTSWRNIYANQPYTVVDLEFLGVAPSRTMPGRTDAPEGGTGRPCGASYISKAYNCTKNTGSTTKPKLKTAAKVALAAGVIAGGAYLIKRKDISGEAWEKSPFNIRKNPKLSPDQAQKIVDEAIAGGQKWDVQEKINARRRAERATECGGGLGKIQAPAKFDAAVPNPRCQAGAGAFGTYFVHPSEQYGIKLYRNGDDDDVQWEFDRLAKAARAGVNVPDPKAINAVKDEFGDVRAQTLVLGHMKGYKDIDDVYGADSGTASRAPLIVQRHIVQEFRKLHTAGLAHGDIHTGNILVHPRSKRVALVDFGYATELDDRYQPANARTGVENLLGDMRRLPEFVGFGSSGSDDFLRRYRGVLENVEEQANFYLNNYDRDEKFELAVKRFHDALETELLWNDRKPRSRFISGAEQPRIPGLTRRILTAQRGPSEIAAFEKDLKFRPSALNSEARRLGVKPPRLFLALKPERDARLARARKQPFNTPLVP